MQYAAERQLDRMVIVHRIDAQGVNLPAVLAQIQEAFGKECLPLNLPADGATRVVDCFFNREGGSDFGSVDDAHRALVEQVVEVDFARESFVKDVARARTFGFVNEVEALRAAGLAMARILRLPYSDPEIVRAAGMSVGTLTVAGAVPLIAAELPIGFVTFGGDLVMVMELADAQLQDRFDACRREGRRGISHFGPEANLLSELESLVRGIELIGETTPRTLDHLASFGERLSVRIVAAPVLVRCASLTALAHGPSASNRHGRPPRSISCPLAACLIFKAPSAGRITSRFGTTLLYDEIAPQLRRAGFAALAVVPALLSGIGRLHPEDAQLYAAPVGLYLLAAGLVGRRNCWLRWSTTPRYSKPAKSLCLMSP